MSEKDEKNDKNECETLAENEVGWIQHHKDEDSEWYDIFLNENLVMFSVSPKAFEKLRTLFKMLESKNNKQNYVS